MVWGKPPYLDLLQPERAKALQQPVSERLLRMEEKHFQREDCRAPVCVSCGGRYPDGFWFQRCEGGWEGVEDRPVGASLYVCQDCTLYECEVVWSIPPRVFSADVNDLDGEEPRLSRLLRRYSGFDRNGC
jgi:hypothetical protein